MKTLEALFHVQAPMLSIRTTLELPDPAPDVPLELHNPLGLGKRWRRTTADDQRPAVYEQLDDPPKGRSSMTSHRELHAEMRLTATSAPQALVVPLDDGQPAAPETLIDPLIGHPGTWRRQSAEDERPARYLRTS